MAFPVRARPLTVVGVALTLTSALGHSAETGSDAGSGSASRNSDSVDEVVYVYGTRQKYLEETINSATRTPTPVDKLPQSVFVITRDVIDDQAMTGMAELVRFVPGVTMAQGEGHRDAPVLRGNLSTADFFIDGLRDDLQYLRDLYNTERVDVLKGPAALVFGRGTGGGALNRIAKTADAERVRNVDVTLGLHDQFRLAADWGGVVANCGAARINLLAEEAGSFRESVAASRRGISPTWGANVGEKTRLDFFGEYFTDERTVDRGVPSENGRPWQGSRDTYFGNPDLSNSDIRVLTARSVLRQDIGRGFSLRAAMSLGDYRKFYDNVYAGGSIDSASQISKISSYLSQSDRQNLLTQLDLTWKGKWAGAEQTWLLGLEAGRQNSGNLRINAASALFSLSDRGRQFRPDFSIAPALDNRNDLRLTAALIQGQASLTPNLNAVFGLRWDRFDLRFDDLRPDSIDFLRKDEFVSPKLGLMWEPMEGVSIYSGWSRASLPQSGEQFNSLNATRAALDPEKFESSEIGLRWKSSSNFLLSAAMYRLDRTNTTAPGPTPGTTVLTGSQRSEGVEFALQGELIRGWNVIGSMAIQDSKITSTTSAAPAGRQAPLVPKFSASAWNRVAVAPKLDVAIGVIYQAKQFASISNAVTLPAYTRIDAALFYRVSSRTALQLNVENLTNERYWFTAHNDDNITPGAGTLTRLTMSTRL